MENQMPVLMATDTNTDIGKIAMDNHYGLWVESGNLDAFTKAVNELSSNSEKRKMMGENGYKYLLSHYTVETSYQTIIKHFEK
jgi:glycosyltransferase involved in cell wall biosynthesis